MATLHVDFNYNDRYGYRDTKSFENVVIPRIGETVFMFSGGATSGQIVKNVTYSYMSTGDVHVVVIVE